MRNLSRGRFRRVLPGGAGRSDRSYNVVSTMTNGAHRRRRSRPFAPTGVKWNNVGQDGRPRPPKRAPVEDPFDRNRDRDLH